MLTRIAWRASAVRAMRSIVVLPLAIAVSAVVGAGVSRGEETVIDDGFTVARSDKGAYIEPAPILSYQETKIFMLGRSHFKRRWIAPITFNGEWGLGPTFIQTRCSECR